MRDFEVPWGFIMDITVVLLLFGAGFHLYQGRQVLAEEGCQAYWQDFKGGYQGQLVNKTEAEWFQEYGSTAPSTKSNQSFKAGVNYSKIIGRENGR